MPQMSLSEATRLAMMAAAEGDLEALGHALADRETAIAAATPAEWASALADGETIGRLLTEMKRNIVSEHNRLEQLRSAFANNHRETIIDLRA